MAPFAVFVVELFAAEQTTVLLAVVIVDTCHKDLERVLVENWAVVLI